MSVKRASSGNCARQLAEEVGGEAFQLDVGPLEDREIEPVHVLGVDPGESFAAPRVLNPQARPLEFLPR